MNFILGLTVFCLSVGISILLSKKHVDRLNYYNSFYSFNNSLKNEVSFTKKSIITIISSNKHKNDYFNKRLTAKFINKDIMIDKPYFITNEEIAYLDGYLDSIGALDAKTQIELLNNAENTLKDNLSKCQNDSKRYKSLYVKLGVLIGLLMFVLII